MNAAVHTNTMTAMEIHTGNSTVTAHLSHQGLQRLL